MAAVQLHRSAEGGWELVDGGTKPLAGGGDTTAATRRRRPLPAQQPACVRFMLAAAFEDMDEEIVYAGEPSPLIWLPIGRLCVQAPPWQAPA